MVKFNYLHLGADSNIYLESYCIQLDSTGKNYNMFTDPNCIAWRGTAAAPGVGYEMADIIINYPGTGVCSGAGLITPGCTTYCAAPENLGKCDANLTTYCRNVPYDSISIINQNCACYLPEIFYQGIANQMIAALGSGVSTFLEVNPTVCLYPECSTNQIQPLFAHSIICPNISSCINSFTIDNAGVIQGNIVATQNNSCNFSNTTEQTTGTPAPSTPVPSTPVPSAPSTSAPSTSVPSSLPPLTLSPDVPTVSPSATPAPSWFSNTTNQIVIACLIIVVILIVGKLLTRK